jgi:Abnormal spindle-like microcephaly-assoc'd, ASPM-SPD-2-Hydin/Protein of unknown function (DUF1573)
MSRPPKITSEQRMLSAPAKSRETRLHRTNVIGVLLLIFTPLLLIGCQGVSAGPSSQTSSALSFSNTSLDFGSVKTGTSKTVSATVTNSGSASVSISSVAFSSKYFALLAPSLPVSVAAGQSATIGINFTPNTSGTFAATMSITSTASNPVANLALTGTGTGTATGHLTLNPANQNFGSVTVGSTQSYPVTLTNDGQATVNISQVSVTGIGFQISGVSNSISLNAGQSTSFTVSFAPSAGGTATGNVGITSDASNSGLAMPLSGTGLTAGALRSSPSTLSFGNVQVGSKATLSETVTNTGGSSVTISQVGVSGTGITFSGMAVPVTIAAGQGTTFNVSFSPTAAGTVSGTLTITSNAPNPTLAIPLSGSGTSAVTAQLAVTPISLGLGNVVVGTSGTASGTVAASGGSVTITGATTNNSVFTIGGISLPLTITAGQSHTFSITFSPLVTGNATATLTFMSNAQPSTTAEALSGTGTPAPTHSVNLSWNASTSSNISGYNIYRALYTGSCGSFSKINSVLNTGTLYTDSAVTDGGSYCYAATTVDSSNAESGYSNILSGIQIPAP